VKSLAAPADKAEILRRLRALGPETPRRWGRMSAHQMVCHLSDAFLCTMGRKPVSPATSVFHRTVVKWVALYVPLRWPPGIATRPEIDQCIGGTRPGDFADDVARVEGLVELFTAPSREFAWQPHPILGPLSDREWLRWGYLHMDHHLRQFGT
jgi:Protein of unknown function (DUF1569)